MEYFNSKKIFLLLTPFLSISFLLSCGNNIKPTHLVKFNGTNCVMKESTGKLITEKSYTENSRLEFCFSPDPEYAIPTEGEVEVTDASGNPFEYTYSSESNKLSFILTDDVIITASSSEIIKIYYIELAGDGHLHLPGKVSFVEDSHKLIPVSYTVDNGYTIDQISVDPVGCVECSCDFGNKIVLKPLENENAQVTITSIERQVNLNSDTMEITEIAYKPNSVEVSIALKDDEFKTKYEVPDTAGYFKIEASDSSKPYFTYKKIDAYHGLITINDALPIRTKTFTILATDYQIKAEVTAEEDEHLSYEIGEEKIIDTRKEFHFRISIKNPSNTIAYCIPYHLDIKLADGTSIPTSGYRVEVDDSYRQSAECKIFAEYVTQDFEITGEAMEVDCYETYIYACGATIGATGKSEVIGYHRKNEVVGYNLVSEPVPNFPKDRIIIENINGDIWRLSDNDLPDIYKDKITINANNLNIAQNVEFDYVAIYIAADNTTVFDKLDWKIINGINEKGWRDSFFDVGDTKKITINRVTYDARIIGFDHDNLTFDTSKAKMTIELAQVITLDDGSAFLGKFDERIGEDFRKTIYDDYLQKNFYPLFPTDLRSCIKEVNKPVETWDGSQERKLQSYDTKIFPLSVKELNLTHAFYWHPEGDTYSYYNSDDDSKQIKKNCEVSGSVVNPVSYWTRSVLQADDYHQSCYVNESGKTGSKDVDKKIGYMVAFCI